MVGDTNDTEVAFREAIKEAKKSKFRYRLGAIAISNGQIVARAFNQRNNHPFLFRRYGFHSIHAEAAAVLKSKHYNPDTLIVVRILRNNNLTCSYPCKKCQQIIKDFGFKKVIYIDWNGKTQELKI